MVCEVHFNKAFFKTIGTSWKQVCIQVMKIEGAEMQNYLITLISDYKPKSENILTAMELRQSSSLQLFTYCILLMQVQDPEIIRQNLSAMYLKPRNSIYKDLFQVHTQLMRLHSEDNALIGYIYIITTVKTWNTHLGLLFLILNSKKVPHSLFMIFFLQ